jgi:ubiquitin C-terminal hydrolase
MQKPYVERKDSEGRPDPVVAQEHWANHLARNRSIVVDLFQGQIKSRLQCLECKHTSVTFDPFTFLTLPLPGEGSSCVEVSSGVRL